MNKKRILVASFMTASLLAPFAIRPAHTLADDFYSQQNNADSADITNWVANSPAKISQNMQSQHIDVNNLNGTRYVIQWGDTLSGISAATGIPVQKIAYDNNIHNINLIYAGDVLILNRDGSAPSNWNIYGNGNQVAQTRVTINYTDNSVNFFHIGDNNHVRITNNVIGNDNDNDNENDSNNSKTEYEAPSSAKEGLATAKSADNVASSQQAQSSVVSSNKPVNGDTDNQQSANSQLTGNSKANTAKSSDDNNKQNNDASSSSTMSTRDFENKVQDDINQDLNNDGDNSSINFTSYSDDDDSSSSSSGNTTQLYDNDQDFTLKSTKMTDRNAQKLADKIYKQLKSDNKLDDLKNADSVQVTISSDDDGFNVNFNVTSHSSSSSSSDDQGQQSSSDQQADDQNNDNDDD